MNTRQPELERKTTSLPATTKHASPVTRAFRVVGLDQPRDLRVMSPIQGNSLTCRDTEKRGPIKVFTCSPLISVLHQFQRIVSWRSAASGDNLVLDATPVDLTQTSDARVPAEYRCESTEFFQSARSAVLPGHDKKSSMAFWSSGMAQNSVILSPSV